MPTECRVVSRRPWVHGVRTRARSVGLLVSLAALLDCVESQNEDECAEARAELATMWRHCDCGGDGGGGDDGGDGGWADGDGGGDDGEGCRVDPRGESCAEVYAQMELASRCACDEGGGVGQGGAQDFGQFKKILEEGGIPGPDTIDDLGFFNEHKIALDPPACGLDVCLHGELGVMGNMISGSNCTLMMLGMNTPVDPDELPRPPLNLGLAIDTSGSMQGEKLAYVQEGLIRMLDALEPEDRVTLVTFSSASRIEAEYVDGYSQDLLLAINGLTADGSTNIYAGLDAAYKAVERHAGADHQNRVILLSDGLANAGITDDALLLSMSAAYNTEGYSLTTIGMGEDFNPELMRQLSESGAGAFYFLQDPQDVQEVFEEEVKAFLVPLAFDVSIDVDVAAGYELRGTYGTKLFEVAGDGAHMDIPVLQLAHRESASDNANGRRGGGGAIVIEVLPDADAVTSEPGDVGTLTMEYRIPGTEEYTHQVADITSPLAPGDTPADGLFTTDGVAKSFVMLNLYMGFEMAATQAASNDYGGALAVLLPLGEATRAWVADHPDDDLEDDLRYVDMFIANLRAANTPDPEEEPPDPWPGD